MHSTNLTTKLKGDLQKTQQELHSAKEKLDKHIMDLSKLTVSNQKLEAALGEAKQAAALDSDPEGLKERIEG